MPLTLLRFPVTLEEPWPADERLAHNMATTLRGAIDRAILDAHCTQASCEPHKRCPLADCIAGVLTKPSTHYGKPRDHPPSFSLDVEGDGLARTVSLTLWGKNASVVTREIEAALRRVAQGRALVNNKPVPFGVGRGEHLRTSLGAWVRKASAPSEKIFTRHRVVLPRSRGPEDLAYLAANVAHDLVQWDLAESGAAADMRPRDVDDAGEIARAAVTAAFSGVGCRVLSESRFHDTRVSRSNGHTRPIDAAELEMELEGDLEPAWPWLRAMSLRGPGSRLSLGISYFTILTTHQ